MSFTDNLKEEIKIKLNRLVVLRDLHGRKKISEDDVYTVFPEQINAEQYEETDGEIEELLLDLGEIRADDRKTLKNCLNSWIEDKSRYLMSNKTDKPCVNFHKKSIHIMINKRRRISKDVVEKFKNFLSLFACKIIEIAENISPRITISSKDLSKAIEYISPNTGKLLCNIDNEEDVLLPIPRFRHIFTEKKTKQAPVYVAKVTQKLGKIICELLIKNTQKNKTILSETLDKVIQSNNDLFHIAKEIGWEYNVPLSIDKLWINSPFIQDKTAFSGPRAYIIWKLAQEHNKQLANKLITEPYNTFKEIKKLPQPSDKLISEVINIVKEKNEYFNDSIIRTGNNKLSCNDKLIKCEENNIGRLIEKYRKNMFSSL